MKHPAYGPLIDVPGFDPAAQALAAKIGGGARPGVRFASHPREYDAVSDLFIGQTTTTRTIRGRWKKQARATFEAAYLTDRIPLFEFTNGIGDEFRRTLDRYSIEYNIPHVILE